MVTRPSFLFLVITLVATTARAQAPAPAQAPTDAIGRVVVVRGQATARHTHGGQEADTPLKAGDAIHASDVVQTGQGAALRLLMADKSLIDLGERSRLSLATYGVQQRERKASVRLWIGRVWARVAGGFGDKSFEVGTENAVAGVRGTSFCVDVNEAGQTQVTVEGGQVELGSPASGQTQMLTALQRGSVDAGGKITLDAVTADDLKNLSGSVKAGGELSGTDAQNLLDSATETLGAQPPAGPTGGEGGGSEGGEGEAPGGVVVPPLDLDPGAPIDGSTQARVRGRIELEP